MLGGFDKLNFFTTLILSNCFLRDYVDFVGYYFVRGGCEETATKGSEVDGPESKDDRREMLYKKVSSANLLLAHRSIDREVIKLMEFDTVDQTNLLHLSS